METVLQLGILCLAIAALVVLTSLRNENRATTQRLDALHAGINALNAKVDALGASSVPTQASAQPATSIEGSTPAQAHVSSATAAYTPPQAAQPWGATAHPADISIPLLTFGDTGAASYPPAPPVAAPTQDVPQAPPSQKVPAAAASFAQGMPPQTAQQAPSQQAVPQATAPQAALHSGTTYQPAPAAAYRGAPQPALTRTSSPNMERIIGKNIFPFLAAGMIFVGLVFLAILVVPSLTAVQRFIAMFALAGLIFVVGLILTRRTRNLFSIAVLGTGIGSLFISILMTRIYFNYLGDIPTFLLLLVWMIVTMALVKAFDSLTLSITAHVGMVVSLIFAFTQGFDSQRAFIIIAYQLIAMAVIIGGSLLAYRKTYRFGLAVSLGMTVVATIAILGQDGNLNTTTTVVSLLIQFVAGSVISFFLATSTAKLTAPSTRLAWHGMNKIVWAILTILTVYLGVRLLAEDVTSWDNTQLDRAASLACIVAFVAHAAISAALEQAIEFPRDMARISILGSLSMAALVRIYFVSVAAANGEATIMALFVLALIALGFMRLLHDDIYAILALVLLTIDAIAAVITPMADISPVLVFGSIAAIMATGVAVYMLWDDGGDQARRQRLPIAALIFAELVFFELAFSHAMNNHVDGESGTIITLTVVVAIVAALRFVNVEQVLKASPTLCSLFAANEYIVSIDAALVTTSNGSTPHIALKILLWVSVALVAAIAIARIIQSRHVTAFQPKAIQYLSAIVLTGITQAPLVSLVSFGQANSFASSMIAMFVALVLVGIGFAMNLKPSRLFGLGLAIFAVLKMATYDVASISPIGRIIAFIVGGLIVFGISALYNYADKRLSHGEPPTPGVQQNAMQGHVLQGQPIQGHVLQGQPFQGQAPVAPTQYGAYVPQGAYTPQAPSMVQGPPAPAAQPTQPYQPQTPPPPQGEA